MYVYNYMYHIYESSKIMDGRSPPIAIMLWKGVKLTGLSQRNPGKCATQIQGRVRSSSTGRQKRWLNTSEWQRQHMCVRGPKVGWGYTPVSSNTARKWRSLTNAWKFEWENHRTNCSIIHCHVWFPEGMINNALCPTTMKRKRLETTNLA